MGYLLPTTYYLLPALCVLLFFCQKNNPAVLKFSAHDV